MASEGVEEEDEPRSSIGDRIDHLGDVLTCESSPRLRGLILQLNEINAPRILMQLVILVFSSSGVYLTEDVDCAEYFAGCMAAAWIKASHKLASYPVACFILSPRSSVRRPWHVPRFFKTLECLHLATIG